MTKNQLFRSTPPRSLCLEVIQCFGLTGFEDSRNFSRKDLINFNSIEKLNKLKQILNWKTYSSIYFKDYVSNHLKFSIKSFVFLSK